VPGATWYRPEPAVCLARAVKASASHCSCFDSWGCYRAQASVKPLGGAAPSEPVALAPSRPVTRV